MFTTHVHNFFESEDNKTKKEQVQTRYNLLRLIQDNKNLFDFLNSVQFKSNDFKFVSLPMIKLIFKHLTEEKPNVNDQGPSIAYILKLIGINIGGFEALYMVREGSQQVLSTAVLFIAKILYQNKPMNKPMINNAKNDGTNNKNFTFFQFLEQQLSPLAAIAKNIPIGATNLWIKEFEMTNIVSGLRTLMDQLTDSDNLTEIQLYNHYYDFVNIILKEYPKVLKSLQDFKQKKTNADKRGVDSVMPAAGSNTGTTDPNPVAGLYAVTLTTFISDNEIKNNKMQEKLVNLKKILNENISTDGIPSVNLIQLIMGLLQIALQVFNQQKNTKHGQGMFNIWNEWVVDYYGPYINAQFVDQMNKVANSMRGADLPLKSVQAIRNITVNYDYFKVRGSTPVQKITKNKEETNEKKEEATARASHVTGPNAETKIQETFLEYIRGQPPNEIFSKINKKKTPFANNDDVIFTPYVDLICLNKNDIERDRRYLLSGNEKTPIKLRTYERENFTINHHVHMLLLSSLDFPNKPQTDSWGICNESQISPNRLRRESQKAYLLKIFKRITNVLDTILRVPTLDNHVIGPSKRKPCPVGCKHDDTQLIPLSLVDYYKLTKDIVFAIINSYDKLGGVVSLLQKIPTKHLLGNESLPEYFSKLTPQMDVETLTTIWGFISTKLFTEENNDKLGLYSVRTVKVHFKFYEVLSDRKKAKALWNGFGAPRGDSADSLDIDDDNFDGDDNSSNNNFTDQTWYQMCESIIKQIHYGLAFIETKMRSTLFIDITTLKIQKDTTKKNFTYKLDGLGTAHVNNFGALVILEPQDYSSCKIYVSKNADTGYGLEVRPRLSATDYILPTLSVEAIPFLSAGGEKESVLYGSTFSQEWAENLIMPILFPQHPNTINMKQHIMSVLDRYQPGYDLIRITRQLLACGPYDIQNGTFHTEAYYNTDIAIRPKTWPILQSFTSANRTATEIYSGKNYVEKSSKIQGVFAIVNNIYFDPKTYIDKFKNSARRIGTLFSENNTSGTKEKAEAIAVELAKKKQENYKNDVSHWIRHILARYGTLPRRVVYINPLHELVKSLKPEKTKEEETEGTKSDKEEKAILRRNLSTALTAKTKFQRKMYPLDIANFDKNVLAKISNRIKIGAVESSVLEFDELPNISDELIEKISNTNEYLITKGKAGGVYRIMDLVTDDKKKDELIEKISNSTEYLHTTIEAGGVYKIIETDKTKKKTKAQYALKLPLSKTRNTNTEEDYSVFRSTESINETLISIAASSLYVRGISPNFIEVKAAYTNKNSGVSLVMEVIQGDLLNHKRVYDKLIDSYVDAGYFPENIPTYESITTNVIAQVIFSIVTFQTELGAVHNDLHLGNIFLKLCDDTKYKKKKLCEMTEFVYDIGGETYKVPNIGILAKIGDFGLTTMGIKRGGADMDNESSHMYDNDKVRIVRMVEFENRKRALYDALVGTDEGSEVQRIIGEFIKGLGVLGRYNAVSQFADGIQRRTTDMFNENIDIAYLMAALRMHPSFQNHPLVFEHREIQREALRHLFTDDNVVSNLIFSEDVLSASVVLAIVQWNNSDIADRITGAVSSTILGDSTSARISPTLLILRSKLLQTLLHEKDKNNGGNVKDESLTDADTVVQYNHEETTNKKTEALLGQLDYLLHNNNLMPLVASEEIKVPTVSEAVTKESAEQEKDRLDRLAAEEAAKNQEKDRLDRLAAEEAARVAAEEANKWVQVGGDTERKNQEENQGVTKKRDKRKRYNKNKKQRQKKIAAEKKRAADAAAKRAAAPRTKKKATLEEKTPEEKTTEPDKN